MAQQDFLRNFQERIDRLQVVRRDIGANIDAKQQFTNNLKTKLELFNDRLRELSGLITNLKTRAEEAEERVVTNNTAIGERQRRIDQLNAERENIDGERQRLDQEMARQREETQRVTAEKQALINQHEAELRQITQQKTDVENQLREVTDQKTAIEEQVRALNQELANRGDQQATHAGEIQRLTQQLQEQSQRQLEDSQRQLQEQSQRQLQEQEQRLTEQINDCERRIVEAQNQLQDREADHTQARDQLTTQHGQVQARVDDLERQIELLTQQNQQLVQRLIDATQAIQDATVDLERLSNSMPNAESQEEVNALLNSIEQSIENIGRAAQGQQMNAGELIQQGRPQAQAGQIDDNAPIQIGDYRRTYNEFIRDLRRKINDVVRSTGDRNNKYQAALTQIQNERDPTRIPAILQHNGIYIINNQIRGGRKTRKNKKQRGGFIYKTNSKRRSTSSRSKRSTRRITSSTTSRRSSRSSR
jgi:chromosome segregation ATPase